MASPYQLMAQPHPQHEQPESLLSKTLPTGLLIPEGYQLQHYTVKRERDGYLQSFVLSNGHATRVPPILVPTQPLAVPSTQEFLPTQSLAIRPKEESQRASVTTQQESRSSSVLTQLRHANTRSDGYTTVCGVYSPEKSTPVKNFNRGNGDFCCPRCESNFTRPKTVKDHFHACVSKHGNPHALRFTDHFTMAKTEAFLQRGAEASAENSSTDEDLARALSQEIKYEEMKDALSHTSLNVQKEHGKSHDGVHIKNEFDSGANMAYESVETTYSGYHPQPNFSNPGSNSSRNRGLPGPTPDWYYPAVETSHEGSRTPTPNGWNDERQSSVSTYRDSTNELEDDDLDGYMDRRSFFSPTPAGVLMAVDLGIIDEETGMEL